MKDLNTRGSSAGSGLVIELLEEEGLAELGVVEAEGRPLAGEPWRGRRAKLAGFVVQDGISID